MLPHQHRMRTSSQFSAAFRSGTRSGRRNVVVYTAQIPEKTTRIGFIVSKAVGNAVIRNRVKRRLRELAAATVTAYPHGLYIAVRALPASAHAGWEELRTDYEGAVEASLKKLSREDQLHNTDICGGGEHEPSPVR